MKHVGVVTTAVLFCILGGAASAYAQHEQQREPEKQQAKPAQQQAKPAQQQARPEPQQQKQAQQKQVQQKQDQNKQAQQKQDQNKQAQQRARQQKVTPAQQLEQRGTWQQHRAHTSWQSEHRTWQQRGGYNGYRIPDGYFRSYYGRSHEFRIYDLPFMVVGGFPRFQYGGYWFSIVDPWPEYWAANWYENDNIYVDYVDGGYYMYDSRYPGPGIAITISL